MDLTEVSPPTEESQALARRVCTTANGRTELNIHEIIFLELIDRIRGEGETEELLKFLKAKLFHESRVIFDYPLCNILYPTKPSRNDMSEEKRNEIVQGVLHGESFTSIATRLGYSNSASVRNKYMREENKMLHMIARALQLFSRIQPEVLYSTFPELHNPTTESNIARIKAALSMLDHDPEYIALIGVDLAYNTIRDNTSPLP